MSAYDSVIPFGSPSRPVIASLWLGVRLKACAGVFQACAPLAPLLLGMDMSRLSSSACSENRECRRNEVTWKDTLEWWAGFDSGRQVQAGSQLYGLDSGDALNNALTSQSWEISVMDRQGTASIKGIRELSHDYVIDGWYIASRQMRMFKVLLSWAMTTICIYSNFSLIQSDFRCGLRVWCRLVESMSISSFVRQSVSQNWWLQHDERDFDFR